MHGPNDLVFQLFGRVGTSLCMGPTIQLFNCLVEWQLRYAWTQPFSFSIVWQSGNFAMYGPSHLVFQLFGRVETSLCMNPTIQFFNCLVEWEPRYVCTLPFSFSIVCQSGNFAIYERNHLVFQLFGRVGTSLCMDPAILFFNCLGEWELGYVWPETFSLSIVRQGEGEIRHTRIYANIQPFNCFGEWKLGYAWSQTFSFSTESWSVNLDMHGPTYLVFLLFQKLYVHVH